MVEKKFNFYTIFNSYYKNINKSVFSFLYIYDFVKDYRPNLYLEFYDKIIINYFGIFYILSSNFTLYWDLNILNNIIFFKKKNLITYFNIKKLFFFDIKKHLNMNVYLWSLKK